MLIQFSVTNFGPINETQTLNMAAVAAYKEHPEHLIEPKLNNGKSSPDLLKSVAIYGANAAGKSTIIKAMAFVEQMVLYSATKKNLGEEIEYWPFKLLQATREAPSEFEVVFIVDGVKYQYGFAANSERITEEWLFAFPKGRGQQWFSRVYDQTRQIDDYKFGSVFKNAVGNERLTQLKDTTRPNALFLSIAAWLNEKHLSPVFLWFAKTLAVGVQSKAFTLKEVVQSPEKKQAILQLMQAADLGVVDIHIDKKSFDPKALPDDMPDSIREEIIQRLKNAESFDVNLAHQAEDTGEFIYLNFEGEESLGTQKLFKMAGPWLHMLESNRVVFVDELEANLHPHIVEFLLRLVHHSKSQAQLIFTTHSSHLLDQQYFGRDLGNQKFLRRDQIWLVEKVKQATQLYPLSDFSLREDDALEKRYLAGQYGAVPDVKG